MPIRILFVDDEPDLELLIRQKYRKQLRQGEVELAFAGNGREALALAQGRTVDLIVTDINMPVMNGLEMLEALRAVPRKASIPAFILSTESSKSMVERGKKCGATAWIVKPFKPEILIKGIAHVLAKARGAA